MTFSEKIGKAHDVVTSNPLGCVAWKIAKTLGGGGVMWLIRYMSGAKSRKYFARNAKRIGDIIWHLLWDEDSVEHFTKAIKFRCYPYKPELLPKYCTQTQYFKLSKPWLCENEVFVDCGAFDGDTIKKFKESMQERGLKNYKCIGFEPDKFARERLMKSVEEKDVVFPFGVWNKSDTLVFEANGNGQSGMTAIRKIDTAKEQYSVEVRAMDDIPECQDATFIKMDLEGSEQMALRGAENIIKRNKPILTICIYHKDEDMLDIIEYLHSLVPQYKFYVRHHSGGLSETVLYANARLVLDR